MTLSAEAARKALRFDEVRTRAGEVLIVVSAVAYDSEAQEVRKGGEREREREREGEGERGRKREREGEREERE